MAMALFRHRLAQRDMAGDWRVESAGTWARVGVPAAPVAQTVMQERGLDLSAHRSRSVSRELLHSFGLILVMERGQREALQIEFPGVSGRVCLLSEMAGSAYDIPDPITGPLAEVRNVAREIDMVLERGFDRIVALADGTMQRASNSVGQ